MPQCHVCFRHCRLDEGNIGFCGGRICRSGVIEPVEYGRISAIALDPIEKKPLKRFHPGSYILSVGGYGCNLRCPFCQNSDISWGDEVKTASEEAKIITADHLVTIAERYRNDGNIGIAFTYNEPLICYEFIRDTAKLSHEKGLKNVIVSNGTAELSVLSEIAPYIDAMNIDLKCFDPDTYSKVLGGDLDMTKNFITEAVKTSYVELTCLIVPGISDSTEMMVRMSEWIASIDENIPLHVSRFFPRFHMTDRPATSVETVYELADIARQRLKYIYTGNC